MKEKKVYYSRRTGKLNDTAEFTLKLLKKLFLVTYNQMHNDGYFQKYFGMYCVDAGETPGELGSDIPSRIFIDLRKDTLWPIHNSIDNYTEDDLFDIIEYLHDYCSKPLEGSYHSWNDCGWHYSTFDDENGQAEYRLKINGLLADYQTGFELNINGEILNLADDNLQPLFDAVIPSTDKENINLKVENAVAKFRRHKATLDDRRSALRDLADVLEYLRPSIKESLMLNDEKDIYNLANNFGIRHHNTNQKVKYDKAIWYSWMFYYYLATIHASIRLIARQ